LLPDSTEPLFLVIDVKCERISGIDIKMYFFYLRSYQSDQTAT